MRDHVHVGLRSRSIVLAASLAVSVMVASGCGSRGALGLEDWQRDFLAGLVPSLIPIPFPGPAGPAGETGPAGPQGPAGQDGAPGPDIIIARAVVNADETLENTDDVAIILNADVGTYHLSIDLTGDVLPAGTTEDDFEVFLTLKEGTDQELIEPFYVPVSLVGTDLRIDVFMSNGDGLTDHAFSVTVLLPAG